MRIDHQTLAKVIRNAIADSSATMTIDKSGFVATRVMNFLTHCETSQWIPVGKDSPTVQDMDPFGFILWYIHGNGKPILGGINQPAFATHWKRTGLSLGILP